MNPGRKTEKSGSRPFSPSWTVHPLFDLLFRDWCEITGRWSKGTAISTRQLWNSICTKHISSLTSSCKSLYFSDLTYSRLRRRIGLNSFISYIKSSWVWGTKWQHCNKFRHTREQKEEKRVEILRDHRWHPFLKCSLKSQRLIKSPINVYCFKLLRASLSKLLSGRVAFHTHPSSPLLSSALFGAVNTKFRTGSTSEQRERDGSNWKQSVGLSRC